MSDVETENPDLEPDEQIEGDDGEQDAEQDAGPEQAPPDTGRSSEKIMQAADKENRRYMKALDKILGPDEARHECPACKGLGVSWAPPEDQIPLVQGDDAEPCPDCLAYGEVLTGSKNPQQSVKPCAKCGGRGWREKITPLAAVATYPPAAEAAPQVLSGQWIPGKGFVPYGSEEALPNTAGLV